ncbi:MAG: phenylalanine--tRNA ligase subunit beta [Alphaproteobacteria bacterium]|nr:phenylalanine--tRNA ligase subunit beta [Alphaproteobacteria bacterium]MDE2630033.1 phenylalanine--tRNA ligase subunit beta [Alphaproteobacteria bacterium]
MKFSLSWLKDHLDTDAGAAAIADKLTGIGLEVESVEDAGAQLKDFVVGYVVSAEKHPNADKLKLCVVDTGTGSPVQVVCGAPNAHTGMKGVFARPGTVIPASGEVLKIGTIRGVESRGMLCSGRELLISDDHDGIIELADDAKVGEPASKALGLTDAVIDVAITPNRGDCTSVYGIARDLAAAGLGKLKTPPVKPVAGKFPCPKKIALNFTPESKSACPLFAGRVVRGVKNGPSPKWVRDRLKAIGLRPISALVDVSNLIAHDRGRPLHVYDADKLRGNVQARLAKDGERILALDGKTYILDSEMCVIADDVSVHDIGGIMGGEESGCCETTANVFIEAAYFDPVRIAATGRKLQLQSDARYRFERGVDPEFVVGGLELATRFILDWCGGEPSEIVVAGAIPPWRRAIRFSPATVKRLGGLDVPRDKIVRILTNLGFTVEGANPLQVIPPSWRGDIDGPADLVEEVVRIFGLEHVPSVPMSRPHAIARPVLTPAQKRARLVRRALAARGFNETISFTFIPRADAQLFGGGDDARQLENPIAADLDALRPSLLPSLLAAAECNIARGTSDLMLFEIGAAFDNGMPGGQQTVAAGLRVGQGLRSWTKSSHPADTFDAKADMLAVLEAAAGSPMTAPVKAGAAPWYHPGRSGTLALGPKVLARFGELHPKVLARFALKVPASAFEIFLEALPEPKSKGKTSFAPSPYQAVERDFAFVVEAKVTAEEIVRAVKSAERALIESVTVFDVYEGKGIPEGKKSLAVAVRLQPREKTLTDAEIDVVAQKIVAVVAKATGATLRS